MRLHFGWPHLPRDALHIVSQGIGLKMFLNLRDNIPLKRESSVVAPASHDKLTCFDLLNIETLFLLQFYLHIDVELFVDINGYQHGLEQVPVALIILAVLKVNASDVVEG